MAKPVLRTLYSVLSTQCLVLVSIAATTSAQQTANLPPLRQLPGRHILIHTDLPSSPEIDELPRLFDAAVPLWCQYFGVDPAKAAAWKMTGCVMQDKARFEAAGLYPANLPSFPHGFARGSQLWLFDQPSSYYRRHLLLHEGTHQFMEQFLGGCGPPWYSEGMAELLGTHQWKDGKLLLGIVPRTKEEVPYWGRVKVIKDDYAAGKPLSLLDVMNYDHRAHIRTEAYAWSWAAAYFLDQHPLSQPDFRDLKSKAGQGGAVFSADFRNRLKEHWSEIAEEWQLFVAECDYGYDVARAAVIRKPAVDLPAAGTTVTITADRGWQSSGLKLQAGKTYRLTATGRFEVVAGTKPWISEPGGVTIRYHQGQPLGKLLATVSDLEAREPTITPFVRPHPIGLSSELKPEHTGTLYLKINEHARDLIDNRGALQATVRLLNPEPRTLNP